MPLALCFLGSLAFVAYLLWLRERRVETVDEVLATYARDQRRHLERFEAATKAANQNADALQRAANDVKGMRDELTAVRLQIGLRRRPAAQEAQPAQP